MKYAQSGIKTYCEMFPKSMVFQTGLLLEIKITWNELHSQVCVMW